MEKKYSLESIKQCEAKVIKYFNKWGKPTAWDSSSENLDKQLAEQGYETSYKFAHQYRFPEGKTNAEYEAYLVEKYRFHLNVNGGNIGKLSEAKAGSLLAATNEYILRKMPLKELQIREDLKKLQELNPEISEIKIDQKSFSKMFFALAGAAYNFQPEDINAYIERLGNKEEDTDFNKNLMEKTGLNVSYILSKGHQEKLTQIVEHKNRETSRENFINFQRGRGHFDD